MHLPYAITAEFFLGEAYLKMLYVVEDRHAVERGTWHSNTQITPTFARVCWLDHLHYSFNHFPGMCTLLKRSYASHLRTQWPKE